jgi:hypothetical protein
MEDVDHEVHEVEQRPTAASDALDMVRAATARFHGFEDPLREGAHVRIRRSRRDDEVIGRVADGAEIQQQNIHTAVFLEGANGGVELPLSGAADGVGPRNLARRLQLSAGVGSSIW